ncbi:putative defense protein 3 [Lingula anatina]|uniref:Defense protein 3 n=1 Tax=Lingula anatina TaxID=7574 RepID=A0A1S3HIU8_LINAN|nr:putative defense protein 3 [Lingula anatina]|eukprot:XP_013386045.1 putative defense protein 3 [Lingula anatina]
MTVSRRMNNAGMLIAAMLLLYAGESRGYGTGPPEIACSSMRPSHYGASDPFTPSPYTITVSKQKYKAGESIDVTLKGANGEKFKGFFVQARKHNSQSVIPVGTFTEVTSVGSKNLCRQRNGDHAISHSNSNQKSEVVLRWTAPAKSAGDIVFRVTVVMAYDTFWDNQESAVVKEVNSSGAVIG